MTRFLVLGFLGAAGSLVAMSQRVRMIFNLDLDDPLMHPSRSKRPSSPGSLVGPLIIAAFRITLENIWLFGAQIIET